MSKRSILSQAVMGSLTASGFLASGSGAVSPHIILPEGDGYTHAVLVRVAKNKPSRLRPVGRRVASSRRIHVFILCIGLLLFAVTH